MPRPRGRRPGIARAPQRSGIRAVRPESHGVALQARGDGWRGAAQAELSEFALTALTPVILFLREPKEKIWGLLLTLDAGGVVVRGLALATFEDWLRQEARGDEPLIQPSTLFYPMHRVERVERDESVGPIAGCADRFAAEVGRSVFEAVGLPPQN